MTLLAASGCGDALAARPRVFGPTQIVGHIGHGLPFDAQTAVADNGRAGVVWARSPQPSGTAIELATARPGERFSRPETITHVPFGPLHMALGISNSGEVIVALAPESPGGLEVVMRSANGTLRPPQWIVRPPVPVLDAPSLAVEADGTALMAWRAVSTPGIAGGAAAIGAAWREHGRARFGRPLSLGSMRYPSLPQALFVAPSRGAIGLTSGFARDPTGCVFNDAQVAFVDVGHPFGAPLVLNTAGAHGVGVQFAPDGEGGLFATWTSCDCLTLVTSGSLWTTRVTSSGQQQVPQRLATGFPLRASLSTAGHRRAILVWDANTHGIDGAELGPELVSPFTNDVPEQQTVAPSVAVDGAGAGVVAWAHRIKAPGRTDALGLQQIRYATIPPGAHGFCPTRQLATSTEDPRIAIGRRGGFILWIGTRSAGGPIQVARWHAATADTSSCP